MISLSAICKKIGHDRLAARRFLERRGVVPDKEGKISIEDARTLLTHICETKGDADCRIKAQDLLKKLSGSFSGDWLKALGLEDSDPLIEDAQPEEKPQPQPEQQPEKQPEEKPNFEKEKPQPQTHMKSSLNSHLGMKALTSPITAMVFTFFALLGQTYLFGHLAHKVFESIGVPAPMEFHFGIGFIFECTGILIAASFNDRKIGGEIDGVSLRGIWLFVFFAVQVISDLCLFGVIKNPTVGTVIVALAMPIALLGYANLYMEENRGK
jgi:hypothetical protein